jgi:uncharacterized membrane protein
MDVLTTAQQEAIVHAIGVAENQTSGEIRVAVDRSYEGDAMERALDYFHKLKMDQTTLRNGVLIYVAVDSHQFAIVGDKGINEKVPADFWEQTKKHMLAFFRNEQLAEGIVAGVEDAGIQLSRFFPRANDDVNELPNNVLIG